LNPIIKQSIMTFSFDCAYYCWEQVTAYKLWFWWRDPDGGF